MQFSLHFLRDEETEVEQRTHRCLKISQLSVDGPRAEAGQIGDFAHRLETSQNAYVEALGKNEVA